MLSKVLGKKDKKYIRTYGIIPNNPTSLGLTEIKKQGDKNIATDAKPSNAKVEPRDEKMEAMEKRRREMEEEISRMRKTMMAMQQFISTLTE